MCGRTSTRTPSRGKRPVNLEIDAAQCRSAMYALLARSLEVPGTSAADSPAAPDVGSVFAAAAAALGFADAVAGVEIPPPEPVDARMGRHQALFGHTARGRVPPYETEYGADEGLLAQPRELADVAGFLAAFGVVVDPARRERVDHVRCELEFMAFLALKEATARAGGDAGTLEATLAAERLFLRDHLGGFAPALGARLVREPGAGVYAAVGEALRRFVTAECARFGVAPGGPEKALRVPTADPVPMACATCPVAEASA